MGYLDETGMEYLIQQIRANLKFVENRYAYTTESAMTVSFTVPSYTSGDGQSLDVYINGLHVEPTVDYTVSGSVVTLTKELDAGQTVTFVVRSVEL